MEAEILKFLEHKKQIKEALRIYVINKEIPLEFRWNLFFKSELGEVEYYYEDFSNLDDEFYPEMEYSKYQYVQLDRLVESLEKPRNNKFLRKTNETQTNEEAIIELKEEILKKFLKAFIFDW